MNITRCADCYLHYDFTRHSEDEYTSAFDALADMIGMKFPQAEVVGNYEKPTYSGTFDVYVRGLGPVE